MPRRHAKLALLLLFGSAGCGKGAERAAACVSEFDARHASVAEQQRLLDDALAGGPERAKALDAAAKAADAKLLSLTVADRDVLSYPDRVKGRVAAGKMRLASMTPLRSTAAEGALAGSLKTIGYDLEIQGDYRAVAKMLAAVYDQPKAIFVDRLEVNISDEYKRWATVKAQVRVYSAIVPPTTPTAAPSGAFTAAAAPFVPEGCDSTSPEALRFHDAQTRLAAREGDAKLAAGLERREVAVAATAALAADLVRQRDDNRAAFTSRADELVAKAKEAVTGFAELRFKANGEPDWQ